MLCAQKSIPSCLKEHILEMEILVLCSSTAVGIVDAQRYNVYAICSTMSGTEFRNFNLGFHQCTCLCTTCIANVLHLS